MKNTSTAIWTGTGKEGTGKISSFSKVLENAQFNYNSRFEQGIGTTPEELIAAAHAGCFSMKTAFTFDKAGFPAEHLEATCHITFKEGVISNSHLKLKAKIKNVDKATFEQLVKEAAENCPVSKVLNTSITHEAILEQ
ncbi:MAG: OsmC family peroxiredoxin [Bacteroidota bacterium]|nr:OsmC family peroxiredoxin [Bacteroidota bacterium]